MTDRAVTLVGSGALRAEIDRRIAGRAGGPSAVTVAVSDGWDASLLTGAAATAAAEGSAFLGVHVELGRAVLGPLVLPGVPGCLTCVATRRAPADFETDADRAVLLDRYAARLAEPSTWLTAFAVNAIAGLVSAEVEALSAGRAPRTLSAMIVVELDRLTVGVHPFLPDPHCRDCASPRADGPAEAEVRLVSRPTLGPGTLRVTELTGREEELRERYVDEFAGLVTELREVDACGLPVTYAGTGWNALRRTELGIGRATGRTTSRLAAILEAVERRAGMTPSDRIPERARFSDIAGDAVDPRTLGLLSPSEYRDAKGYQPFDPDRDMEWVWGYSFGRGRPVLVPRTYAYYGHRLARTPETPMVYETSNGCALGGCFEEATAHGLLEVAERDAFLHTWYASMPVPRVAIGSARMVEIPLLAERIERVHGYRVLAFDTSLEHGIPSVMVVAVDGRPDPGRPAVMCAAGAHVDPERACWAALGELTLVVAHQSVDYPKRLERAAAMVADSDLVVDMEHHAQLYGHADTVPRWDFLLGGDEERDFAEAFPGRPEPTRDLRDDLVGLIDRYRSISLDVIVVDQTGPEQRAGGLSSVKVIVPGTLPMTFGHRNRRVHGLPRLRTVPMLLGHRSTPLSEAEINPYPHPFP